MYSDAKREREEHRQALIMTYWQALKEKANYDQLLQLRDLVEEEIDLRITKAEWDFYDAPQIYKFHAEEEEAHNEL